MLKKRLLLFLMKFVNETLLNCDMIFKVSAAGMQAPENHKMGE